MVVAYRAAYKTIDNFRKKMPKIRQGLALLLVRLNLGLKESFGNLRIEPEWEGNGNTKLVSNPTIASKRHGSNSGNNAESV